MLHITACDCTVDFTISFMVEGQEYYTIQTSGETLVRMPTNPTKEGYSFKGWFWDDEIWEIPFTVNSLLDIPLQSDMCVYAKFEKIHLHDLQYHGYVEVTCEEDGCLEYWSCNGCDMLFADVEMEVELNSIPVVPATGHEVKVVNGRKPTCSTLGYTEGQECSKCSKVLVKQQEIAKLPHKYDREIASDVYRKSIATCTTPAEYYYSCVCGRSGLTSFYYGDVLPHTYSKQEYVKENIYHAEKCDDCDYSKNKNIHTIDDTNKCTVCNKQLVVTNNLSYTLSADKTYYTLTGIGYATETDIVVPERVNNIPVKEIKAEAFLNNTKITSVWLSSNIESIGEKAFSSCTNLEYVHFGKGVRQLGISSFSSCSKLDNVVLPNVTTISNYAFNVCSSLTSIEIPKIETIGIYAFNKCGKLKSVDLSNASNVGGNTFQYCYQLSSIELGTKLKTLPTKMFYNCTSLTQLNIPSSVTTIGSAIVQGCTSLASISLPKLNGNIGSLYGLTVANHASIPSSLKTVIVDGGNIADEAFKNCKYIETIILNDAVSTIGVSSFNGCERMTDIQLGKYVVSIAEGAFTNTKYYNTNANWVNNLLVIDNYLISCRNTALGTVTIPNGIKLIAYGAFNNCDNILEIVCPNSLVYINGSAFKSCNSLESVILGSSVTTIGNFAFNECVSLNSISIPNSVKSIDYGAFLGCTSLKQVHTLDVDKWLEIGFISNGSNPLSNGADLYVNGEKLVNLVIPTECTIIKQYAFYGCTSIETVYVHEDVTSIEIGAFTNCTTMTGFEFAEGVEIASVEKWFTGCTSMTELVLASVPYNDTGVGYIEYLFNNSIPTTLVSLTIRGGDLVSGALTGCTNLTSLVLNNVSTVESGVLVDSTKLDTVSLSGVRRIASDVFKQSNKITNVYAVSVDDWLDVEFGNRYANPLSYGANLWIDGAKITVLNVTKDIKAYAFYGCKNIEEVHVSNDVKSIGNDAFYNCEKCTVLNVQSLEGWLGVVLGNSGSNPMNQSSTSSVFKVADSQEIDIYIPNTITKINAYAFVGCDDVRSLYVPTSVTTIGYRAFGDCYFMDATFPRSNDSLTSGNNYVDYTIGYYVEYLTITSGVISGFNSSPYLAYVIIGKEVTSIADEAFRYSNLSTIEFESGSKCTSIGSYAFSQTNISGITIPSGVSYLGTGVLSQCRHLRDVDMSGYTGNNVPTWAFEGCADLCNVTLPDTIKSFYEYCFSGCVLLDSIDIPSSATYFASGVFSNTGLTEFTFNTGVTQVPDNMFYGCEYLERVVLSGTITYIGDYAFTGCTSLSYLYLPDSVFENERFVNNDAGGGYYDYSSCIGYDAFFECKIETVDAESTAYGIVLYSMASNEYNSINPVTHNYTKLNIVYND